MKKTMALMLMCVCVGLWATVPITDYINEQLKPNQKLVRLQASPYGSKETAVVPTAPMSRQPEDTISYDTYSNVNSIGYNTTGQQWAGAIRLTTDELLPFAGYNLIAVVIYRAAYTTINDTLIVYGPGTATQPGAVLTAQAWTPVISTWNRIDLTTPVFVDGVSDIWISDLHTESPGGWPLGCGPGPYVVGKGDWVWDASSGWYEMGPIGLDYNWNIWAIVEAGVTSYIWDFETGHQGWTHTNGQAFPAGWDVQISGLHAGYVCPAPGDSSYWIDSDAAGSSVTIWDTAYSPVVRPPINMTWLKFGVCFYLYTGGNPEWMSAGIQTFSGGAWQPCVELRNWPASVGPMWDSVNVSAYTSAESIRVFFSYNNANYEWWATFDNVELRGSISLAHDVGVAAITSPPAGSVTPGIYDVIGQVHNYGENAETFDVVATVYDTVGMVPIFTQTVNMAGFAAGGDSLVNFGQVTFDQAGYFLTVVYTNLAGDMDLSNDTVQVFSTTALMLGDVIYELDIETPAGDNNMLGVEFDGKYFYVTGGGNGADPNYVYVIDTLGNLIWTIQQPGTTGWGWRDVAWDWVYTGPDRIDTLYASSEASTVKFGIDLTTGILQNYGTISSPVLPCRALAWDNTDSWFFTANWDPLYKFDKTNPNIQSVAGPGSVYGSAYDTDSTEGHWVWWHSQNDPGTGVLCQIDQMEPVAMTATGVTFGYLPTLSTGGIAGGMCFYEGFRGADVLFTVVQATPDQICGIFVRYHGVPGVSEGKAEKPLTFGFAPNLRNPVNGHAPISYSITKMGNVALKIYDGAGRIVSTLVDGTQNAGAKTVTWDAQNLANGVYFVMLEAEGKVATHKLVLVK